MTEEKWKKIIIEENETVYSISNFGRVRNDLYMRILTGNLASNGYLMVHLHCRINRICTVHRLVMKAFCPCDCMDDLQINHKDGNKINNHIDNLEWCTAMENIRHSFETGLQKYKMRPCHMYDLQGNYIKSYANALEASKDTGINQSDINRCLTEEFNHTHQYQFKMYKKDKIKEWSDSKNKPVFLYDYEGNFLHKFPSQKACGEYLGINPRVIGRYLNKERTSSNFVFSYTAL